MGWGEGCFVLVLLHIVSLTHVPLYAQHGITILISILLVEVLQVYILKCSKVIARGKQQQTAGKVFSIQRIATYVVLKLAKTL